MYPLGISTCCIFTIYRNMLYMPHLSKNKLTQLHEEEIYKQLLFILAPESQQVRRWAFGELLTRTEKIMLAKRCAAIVLCSQGLSPYNISEILSLSPSTTARIYVRYEQGAYLHLTKLLKRDKYARSVFSIIDRFIKTFPQRNGRRWDWLER